MNTISNQIGAFEMYLHILNNAKNGSKYRQLIRAEICISDSMASSPKIICKENQKCISPILWSMYVVFQKISNCCNTNHGKKIIYFSRFHYGILLLKALSLVDSIRQLVEPGSTLGRLTTYRTIGQYISFT